MAVILATNLSAAAFLLAPPLPAQAAGATCSSQYQSYFDGRYQWSDLKGPSPHYYEGASAHLTAQAVAFCPGDARWRYNFSYAWTMVANNNGQGWIQSGFGQWNAGFGCLVHWSEASLDGINYNDVFGSCVSPGEVHQYWQQYTGQPCSPGDWGSGTSHGNIYSNVDTIAFMSICPWGVWTTPFSIQYMGETKYLESDMPGNDTHLTNFSDMEAQRFSDNIWEATPCILDNANSNGNPYETVPPGRWRLLVYSCSSMAIDTSF